MILDALLCGMRGHEYMQMREDGRMFLRCLCGHETQGWQIDVRALSPRELDDVYHEMLEAEQLLHGGG